MLELGALQAMEVGGLCGLRPTWCLAAVSLAMAVGLIDPAGPLAFVGTWPAFVALLVVAVVEAALEREIEIEPFLGTARLVLSSGASVACSRMLSDPSMSAIVRATRRTLS